MSHDFSLPILSQWQNIDLISNTITLSFEPYALKAKIRNVIF